jgi:uncharacterized membrane protein YhaH (DUF805 family)
MNLQHLFLSFAGRTSKRDYWLGLGGLLVVGIVAGLLPTVGAVLSIALLYPFTALTVKRLHDFGRSGWLAAIPIVPALIAATLALLAASAIGDPATMGLGLAAAGLAAVLSTIAIAVGLTFLVWAGIRAGDEGINVYGAPCGGAILL